MQCVYLINLLFNILLWSSVRMAAYCRWFSGSFPPSLVPPHCRPSWGAGHGWIPLGRSPDHWLWLHCSQGELRAAQSPPSVLPRPRSPLASASSTPPAPTLLPAGSMATFHRQRSGRRSVWPGSILAWLLTGCVMLDGSPALFGPRSPHS